MTKIYVHKWVLSTGNILVVEGEFSKNPDGSDLFKPSPDSGYHLAYFHKGDYSLTKDEALLMADERREKKIASLQKQIDKLNSFNFSSKTQKI